jgi:hypothetical protein
MDSTRSFLALWFCISLVILAYAGIDLWMHPALYGEVHFTMQPDVNQIGDLWHWGGRLLKEGAISLLVANAIVMGGLVALVGRGTVRFLAKLRGYSGGGDSAQTTFVDAHASGIPSVPPPPNAA